MLSACHAAVYHRLHGHTLEQLSARFLLSVEQIEEFLALASSLLTPAFALTPSVSAVELLAEAYAEIPMPAPENSCGVPAASEPAETRPLLAQEMDTWQCSALLVTSGYDYTSVDAMGLYELRSHANAVLWLQGRDR